jgi:hypothetical protein
MHTYTIERRPAARKPWKATSHVITARTANEALRKFGARGAFASPKVKVVTGKQTGRQYRAVKSA